MPVAVLVRLKLPRKFSLSQMLAALSRLRSWLGVKRNAPATKLFYWKTSQFLYVWCNMEISFETYFRAWKLPLLCVWMFSNFLWGKYRSYEDAVFNIRFSIFCFIQTNNFIEKFRKLYLLNEKQTTLPHWTLSIFYGKTKNDRNIRLSSVV